MPSIDGKTSHGEKPAMLVVVHDFTSTFLSELTHIVERLEPLLGQQMSAAIVPRWHGNHGCPSNVQYRALLTMCSEHLLHGWTHQSANPMRPISLLTDSSDEFSGLDEATIISRLEAAQTGFRELTGKNANGFLPPAWQLPIAACRLPSLKFVVRFRCLESCQIDGRTRSLATTSWDWGRIGWIGYGGEWVGYLLRQSHRTAIPCIAIHPVDVRRGYFDRAVKLIETLSHAGFHAVTASELMLDRQNIL